MPPFLTTLHQQQKWQQFRQKCQQIMEDRHKNKNISGDSTHKKSISYCTKRILGIKKYQHGLEVGCGQGALTSHWLGYCQKITCLDISSSAIEKSKLAHVDTSKNIEWVQEDIHQFHRPSKSYDVIFLSQMIEHLGYNAFPKQVTSTFLNIHHMLKDGGDLIIVNPMYSGNNLQNNLLVDQILEHIGFQVDKGIVAGKYPEQFSFRKLRKTSSMKLNPSYIDRMV